MDASGEAEGVDTPVADDTGEGNRDGNLVADDA